MKEFNYSIRLGDHLNLIEEKQFILDKLEKTGEEGLKQLINLAVETRKQAYAPYSNYQVGASILCFSGQMYSGCNTEVVSYSQTGHAESNAINQAIIKGENKEQRKFIEIIVVSATGESGPCGACRQEIIEHCDNAVYIDVDAEGNPLIVTTMNILFPYAFTPTDLEL
ncbi:MAG: Cytidine deaminase [Candidatus Woesebacteria bacterium GW2011_GWB1_39_12]|uniref:Cytidine deaminase n=1 Tax=Candidatus Woesebacteria bacterium GW2011_GWB1_39_12 TaxID=1618574 RepID=A0A0G0MF74_9BACT|nr:MAG: Cytidine deaminase [Candidatus Woesebacteria bacterium GW2011_GWB1_39_12]